LLINNSIPGKIVPQYHRQIAESMTTYVNNELLIGCPPALDASNMRYEKGSREDRSIEN